jgi:hypothetical protein
MTKILAERFFCGMALGMIIGFSFGLYSFGSFLEVVKCCVVGGLLGGCVGLLFPKKAIVWVLEFLGKGGVP